MGWRQYLIAIVLFNAIGLAGAVGAADAVRAWLPFNPQHLPGLSWDLALNTAVSFVSNTNWQAYAGETTMSYLSQMVGLAVQNFLSAATGIAVIFVLTRAWARQKCQHPRQRLGRPDPHYAVAATADLSADCAVLCATGRAAEPAGLSAVHQPGRRSPMATDGTGRLAGSDQDARYQRRRLL